ncbi:hypothetical protein J1614_005328 [Plenodomus biglobosus]|nr:hypothetical protein J1614_005328 [Plenodomus biglobosus]
MVPPSAGSLTELQFVSGGQAVLSMVNDSVSSTTKSSEDFEFAVCSGEIARARKPKTVALDPTLSGLASAVR